MNELSGGMSGGNHGDEGERASEREGESWRGVPTDIPVSR